MIDFLPDTDFFTDLKQEMFTNDNKELSSFGVLVTYFVGVSLAVSILKSIISRRSAPNE